MLGGSLHSGRKEEVAEIESKIQSSEEPPEKSQCWGGNLLRVRFVHTMDGKHAPDRGGPSPVAYIHLRAHETVLALVCRHLRANKN